MEYMVTPLLKYEDYWDYDKWQVRGTEYDYNLLWILDVPPMDQETEESRHDFASYQGEKITAYNPDPLQWPDAWNLL